MSSIKTYPQGGIFNGKISRTAATSEPSWPVAKKPPKDSSNILVILLDDVGFAQLQGDHHSPKPVWSKNPKRLPAQCVLHGAEGRALGSCSPGAAAVHAGRGVGCGGRQQGGFDLGIGSDGYFDHTGRMPRSLVVGKLRQIGGGPNMRSLIVKA